MCGRDQLAAKRRMRRVLEQLATYEKQSGLAAECAASGDRDSQEFWRHRSLAWEALSLAAVEYLGVPGADIAGVLDVLQGREPDS